ncbi:MAG: glycosyltransferase [Anaerolineae bacterium]|nr:glycosyltransferase [Anaerolineae bacterium]
MESAGAINSKNSYVHFRSANNFMGCHLLKTDYPLLSPLRILMTTDTRSEVWSYSLELAEAFNRKGHQVTWAAPSGPLSREQRRQLRRLPRVEVFENPHLVTGIKNASTTGRWLLHLERQVQPHLIHLNGYAHATLPWQAPKVVAVTICLLSWWQTRKKWINPVGQVSAKKRRAWFSHAAIYALPTRCEPFGLAVLEAAMADCALVLGDIPNLREVWGDTALYVPPDDPPALEVALSLLMADSNYRKLMAKRAYTHAQKFTAERMVEQFLTYCRGLVSFCQPAI